MNEPKWLTEAIKNLGIQEGPGSQNNPVVVDFWKQAGLPWIKDDATPWCAGFANAMLERGGVRGTRLAAAKSFLQWGVPVGGWYNGSIVVFNRPPNPWSGHVGFLVGFSHSHVLVLGGNQGDKVSYAKFPKERIAGKRWPAGMPTKGFELEEELQLTAPLSTNEA